MAGSLIVVALFAFVTAEGAQWSYGDANGPSHWVSKYPICGETRQSPINLPATQDMTYDSNLTPFKLSGYMNPQDYKLKVLNNGHTVQVNVAEGALTVEGGGLPGRFRAAQFHFHWGGDSSQGSEHLFDDRSFPMELHVVHYNEKYGNLSNAAAKEHDGLAVLGFFFVVSETDNSGLRTLLNKLNDVKAMGSMADLTGFSIDSMFPFGSMDASRFFRYPGSLTTPPCYQSVIWTIFENTIPISEQQMAMFRKLQEDATPNSGHVIVNNFRPPQALGSRQVSRSFEHSSASNVHLSSLAFTVLFLLRCML